MPVPEGPAGLVVTDLRKAFAGRTVLDGVSLAVAAGEVVALTGANGAGKTTLLRCVVGTEVPDSGTVTLDGRRLDEREPWARAVLASVLDDLDFFPDLTVAEHLDLLARAHGTPVHQDAVDDALSDLHLQHVADQLPSTLSSGQRRRLALATTVVRPLRVLVLDEPEQRLDDAGRAWLTGHLLDLCAHGVAVLMATHDGDLVTGTRARRVGVGER